MTTSKTPDCCPYCGSKEVVPIAYGEPSPEMRELAKKRKISLGGCIVRNDSPMYVCDKCNKKWL